MIILLEARSNIIDLALLFLEFSDCPSGVARPAKQPEFQLVLHQG